MRHTDRKLYTKAQIYLKSLKKAGENFLVALFDFNYFSKLTFH